MRSRRQDSFKTFEANTSDAWDDGDDDLMKLASAARQKLSQKYVKPSSADGMKLAAGNADSVNVNPLSSELPAHFVSSSASSKWQHHHLPNSGRAIGRGSAQKKYTRIPPSTARSSSLLSSWLVSADQRDVTKVEKFKSLFLRPNLSLDELRSLSWSGIPHQCRPEAWRLLSGYVPTVLERRRPVMDRKRQEYCNLVEQYYDTRLHELHQETFRQVQIDVPRTSPLIPLFQQQLVQELFERVLYIWAIRHPASGYVQGLNDLITPLFVVFLTEYLEPGSDIPLCTMADLAETSRQQLEADCFWCFSKLLDGIQDNYTFAQPGIQQRIGSLKELISRIDSTLHTHLEHHHIEYLQFAFRWMNNLLMREMPLHCIIRLWDTYLSEPDGFASFHLYVCAAFLTRFSHDLQRERDFHGLMLLLQNLPTNNWSNGEVGLLLAEAYRLKFTFADAPNHYRDSVTVTASGALTNNAVS